MPKKRRPISDGYKPTPPSPSVSRRMSVTPRSGTSVEIALRKAMHARGLRYRVQRRIEGTRITPDVVFPSEKIAVYVDGCFWHSCPEHKSEPKNNQEWWRQKLLANAERDLRHTRELRSHGWEVVRFWEHQDAESCADVVLELVLSARKRRQTQR